MSRIGNSPITIPAGVDIKIEAENAVTVKGPKGTLSRKLHRDMIIEKNADTLLVKRPSEDKEHKSLHGLTRTLINNMVVGVTEGFTKTLEINGVGYRAAKQGNKLALTLGFSHPVEMDPPAGITIDVPQPNQIVISGADKQNVGQFAAQVREKRPPEPYKGKGIKYADETIRRKEGKAGGKK
jgi:large subunit ribosomal protein L6